MLLQARLNGRNLGSTSHSARTWLTFTTSAACREPWLLSWPTYDTGCWVSGQLSPVSADVTGTENIKRPQLPHRKGMGPSLREENALALLRGGKGREFLSKKYKNFFLKKSFLLCKISNVCRRDSNIPNSSHNPGPSSRVGICRSLFHPGPSPPTHVPHSFLSKSITSCHFIRKYFNTSLKDKDSLFFKA